MTNPTLGRHLGRWAEVYFTTPAEQREQAVLELLRELEREEREHPELVAASESGSTITEEVATTDHIAALEAAVRQFEQPLPAQPPDRISSDVCSVCQHANLPDQWYCGMCGFRLKGPAARQAFDQSVSQPRAFEPRPPAVEREIQREVTLPSFAMEPIREPETVRGIDRAPVWPLHVEEDSHPSRSKVIALVALVAIASFAFLYQRRAMRPVPPMPAASSQPTAVTPTPAQEPATSAAATEPPANSSLTTDKAPNVSDAVQHAASPVEASPGSPKPAEAVSPAPAAQDVSLKSGDVIPETGNEELARARDLLAGVTGAPNAGQASVWLWKSVGKNNVPAVLLLADLYARGDGVPRSCDQARILLNAALKRGSTEAGLKLRELQSTGCSERK